MTDFQLTGRDFWRYYSNKESVRAKWMFAGLLGDKLRTFLGTELFMLLLDSKILIDKRDFHLSNDDYKLLPAAKAYEGFLRKILTRKKLIEKKERYIGPGDMGGVLPRLGKILKNKKLAKEAGATWDLVRNEICHHQISPTKFRDIEEDYGRIVKSMRLLHEDLYGKTTHESIAGTEDLERRIDEDLKSVKI